MPSNASAQYCSVHATNTTPKPPRTQKRRWCSLPIQQFEWTARSWFGRLEGFHEIISEALLAPVGGVCAPSTTQKAYVVSLGQLDSEVGVAAMLELLHEGSVLEKLALMLHEGASRLAKGMEKAKHAGNRGNRQRRDSSGARENKYVGIELTYGDTSTFLRGLEALVRPPNPDFLGTMQSMAHEHTASTSAWTPFETANHGVVSCAHIGPCAPPPPLAAHRRTQIGHAADEVHGETSGGLVAWRRAQSGTLCTIRSPSKPTRSTASRPQCTTRQQPRRRTPHSRRPRGGDHGVAVAELSLRSLLPIRRRSSGRLHVRPPIVSHTSAHQPQSAR
jgi:hypothetical protein